MQIKKHSETINACRFCFMCRHVCSVGKETKHESDFPRGKGLLLFKALQKTIYFPSDMVDVIYRCGLCGLCRSWCVGGYDMPALIRAARADIVEQGKVPESVARIKTSIEKRKNPFNESADSRFNLLENIKGLKKKAKVLYFVGCHTAWLQPETAISFIDILKKTKEDFTVMADETCCGKPLSLLGYRAEAKKMATDLFRKITETGCKTIVTSCPSCYDAFKRDYKEMGLSLEPAVTVLHATEYLSSLLKEQKIIPERRNLICVTYQDSDYLCRFNEVSEPAREILARLPGIELTEMRWHGDKAYSCGEAGGILRLLHPDISNALGRNIIGQAKDTKAKILVTSCPVTKNTLLCQGDEKIEVCDIVELVAGAI